MLPFKQLRGNLSAQVGALNYTYPAAPTSIVTTAVGTALASAGNGGVAVDVQVSTDVFTHGLVVSAPLNLCDVLSRATNERINDGFNNEVYGRLTHAAGVYTLSLFSLISGVETPYTPGAPIAIDFYFPYRFKIANFPTDALIGRPAVFINDDPTATVSRQQVQLEALTVTGLNAITDLSLVPDEVDNVALIINDAVYTRLGGAPKFSLSGVDNQTITWNATNAGFSLNVGDEAYALYTYAI